MTAKLKSILRRGKIVATMANGTKSARIYSNRESRGYKTGFEPKEFFYLVTYSDNGLPRDFIGLTKDSRRKHFVEHCQEANINLSIVDNEAFARWIA